MNAQRIIRNIIGKGKIFGGKNDLDGDGVLNKDDCQKLNTMRQDAYGKSKAYFKIKQEILDPYGEFIMTNDMLHETIKGHRHRKLITEKEADELFDMIQN